MRSKWADTMTTPTPISKPTGVAAGEEATLPPGFPDAATLERWGREYFARLPAAPADPSRVAKALASDAGDTSSLPDPLPSATEAGLAHLATIALTTPAPPEVPVRIDPLTIRRVSPSSVAEPRFYFLEDAGLRTLSGATQRSVHPPFDVSTVRADFPILQTRVHGRPLIWFDNAATTQKPYAVIERLSRFYREENSNVHRAAHELAARATDAYEGARRTVQNFLGASSPEEIVFVRGATEGINLVAQTWGRQNIREGDEILISYLEHHANIVPWHMLAQERGARLKVIPVDSTGQVRLEELQRLLNPRTKIVSVTHVSNALGTVTPIAEIIAMAHRAGACVLIDGAQSVSHIPVNVQALNADFFVFSGHKVFGPTGIGTVYGRRSVLETLPPWQGGGNMIEDVTFERTRYQAAPGRFEAGTGNIADAAALGTALEYVQRLGLPNIERYEHELLAYATEGLNTVPGLSLIGTAAAKTSVLSFVIAGLDTLALGSALNEHGIATRAGHHCAQPILRHFGHEATLRASLALYNTRGEIDVFVDVLRQLVGSRVGARGRAAPVEQAHVGS